MKQEFEVTIQFEVRCHHCGDELECEMNSHGDLSVWPCSDCIRGSYNEGYDDGLVAIPSDKSRKGG